MNARSEQLDGTAPAAVRILILEDEPLVRMVIREILKAQGFNVDEAQTGEEAIRKFLEARPIYDLLLMDYHLPQMSGPEVLSAIRQKFPATKAILLSGSAAGPEFETAGVRALLKPFNNAELLQLVHETLGSRAH